MGLSEGVPSQPSLFELARVGSEVQTVCADVRDAPAVLEAVRKARPEIVFHLAARPLVGRSFEQPRETYEVKVMGTVNVLDAVRRSPPVRVAVNVTSDKCYENREWGWPYRENEPMGGHDPYSSSKGASELVTSAYRRSFFDDPNGTRLASARAGNVIGGGNWGADRLVPDVMRAALAGERVGIRNPGATRPWQHVLNPLSGYLVLAQRLAEDADAAKAWNFGPAADEARPVGWIVEQIGRLWPVVWTGSAWAATTSTRPSTCGWTPPARGRSPSTRARARLGWAPRWGLETALSSIVEWYLALRDGADMRAVTEGQIAAFGAQPPR